MVTEKNILENSNIFKSECNLLENRIEILIRQFINATNKDYQMKNVGTILKNKCHELDEQFDIYDEYYLERYSLKEEIKKRTLIYLLAAEKLLKNLQEQFDKLNKYSNIIGLNLYVDSVYKKIIDEYNACCDAIANYDINNNLREILINRYNILKTKTLGVYTTTYLQDRMILSQLGYAEKLEEITPEIVKLIEKKEIELSTDLQNKLDSSYNKAKESLQYIREIAKK